MFRRNGGHLQDDMFSSGIRLPENRRKMLRQTWAERFYREFFCRIDEAIFACLYSDVPSRPNVPVNQLVAFEVLKAGRGWSDEEAYEEFCFDMQVRHAIGVEDLGEDIFTLRTVYNFRRALVSHMEETGENLFERLFQQVTGEQQPAFEIRSARLRMDSTQIASNVRAMSRLELLMVVVQRMYRALDKEDQERWQGDLAPYVADSAKHLAYRLRAEEPAQRVTEIGRLLERLASELPAKYRQTKAYEVLCRVLSEHFVVVNHVAMRRVNEDLEARSVQSPDDLEATFRRKAGRGYQGYVANIAETCDDDNEVQLIVDVAVAPNSTDDGQMLVDAIEGLARRTDVETIYTDGGYNGPQVDETSRAGASHRSRPASAAH